MIVDRNRLLHRAAVVDLEDRAQAVGVGFVGTEHAEVPSRRVLLADVPHHLAQLAG